MKINSALSRAELLRAIARSGAWSRPRTEIHPISAAEMRRAIARRASPGGRADQMVVLPLAEVIGRLTENVPQGTRRR